MRKVKRKYDSAHRQVLAEQTRGQILEAARRLFRDRGYGGTTIEEIAKEAGVSGPTVYAAYGAKRSILLKLLDEIEKSADAPALIALLSDRTPDDRARLQAFIDFSVRLFTGDGDLIRIAEFAGIADPDVAAMWETGEARRLESCRLVLAGCAKRGNLRGDLTEDRATDILWALSGPEFYGLFVRGRQWSPKDFSDYLNRLAAEQLLQPQRGAQGKRITMKT